MTNNDRTQQALADWIDTWRDVPELVALVSPVARAWLDFADGHSDGQDPERRSELARVIQLPVQGDQ